MYHRPTFLALALIVMVAVAMVAVGGIIPVVILFWGPWGMFPLLITLIAAMLAVIMPALRPRR